MEYNQFSVIIVYFSGVFLFCFVFVFLVNFTLFILIDYENDKLYYLLSTLSSEKIKFLQIIVTYGSLCSFYFSLPKNYIEMLHLASIIETMFSFSDFLHFVLCSLKLRITVRNILHTTSSDS